MKNWTPEDVKDLRTRLGLTQKEFAKKLGVHAITIIRWEKGTSNPHPVWMDKLENLEPGPEL
jgi:transcriptional regulator with XRE-family HTH domain